MTEPEKWRPVAGWEGCYEVSDRVVCARWRGWSNGATVPATGCGKSCLGRLCADVTGTGMCRCLGAAVQNCFARVADARVRLSPRPSGGAL